SRANQRALPLKAIASNPAVRLSYVLTFLPDATSSTSMALSAPTARDRPSGANAADSIKSRLLLSPVLRSARPVGVSQRLTTFFEFADRNSRPPSTKASAIMHGGLLPAVDCAMHELSPFVPP